MPFRTIHRDADLAPLTHILTATGFPVTVSWTKGVDRSQQQNSLMWKWAQETGDQLGGMTADEVQAEWKLDIGVPILRATDAVFDAEWSELEILLDREHQLALMSRGFPVTRNMEKGQMVRLLDQISRLCAEMGVELTQPDSGLAAWMEGLR